MEYMVSTPIVVLLMHLGTVIGSRSNKIEYSAHCLNIVQIYNLLVIDLSKTNPRLSCSNHEKHNFTPNL